MSVINDMLRDLDHRHGKQPAFEMGTVAVVAPTREIPWRFLIITLAIAAIVAGSYSVIAPRLRAMIGSVPAVPEKSAPEKVSPENRVPEKISPEKFALTSFAPAPKNLPVKEIAPAPKSETAGSTSRAVVVEAVAAKKTIAVKTQTSEQAQPLAAVESVRKQPSQTAEALAEESYRQGVLALRGGLRVDAEREFNNALSLQPQHVATIGALARVYLEDGRLDAAAKLLAPALSANPDALDLRQLLARVQLQSGSAEQALQSLRARQPDLQLHSDYYAMLAAIEQQVGDHRTAAEHYRALLNIDANQAAYWLGLALALDNLQQSRAAIDAYRRANSLNNLPAAARDFARQRLSELEK